MSALSWPDATNLAQLCRKKGGIVVTTNGTFDIIHAGHVEYLMAARQMGDLLLVGLNSDKSVKSYKGPERPINSQESRAIVLSALRMVDGVCIFEESTPLEWLKTIRPQIHVKGGDWDVQKIPETPLLASWGAKVTVVPYKEGFSTTNLIRKAQGVK